MRRIVLLKRRIKCNMQEIGNMIDDKTYKSDYVYGGPNAKFKRLTLQLRKDLIEFEKLVVEEL